MTENNDNDNTETPPETLVEEAPETAPEAPVETPIETSAQSIPMTPATVPPYAESPVDPVMPQDEDEDGIPAADILADLKNRAEQLGVRYHPSIGIVKLREKISLYLREEEKAQKQQEKADKLAKQAKKEEGADSETIDAKANALSLMRIRVTCMDPSKKEYSGEIFTSGNGVVGTVKKYVHFDAPWHVPRIIYNMMADKQYQTFVTMPNPGKGPEEIKVGKLVKTYAIEVLPDLTETERKELAQRQAMASGTAA